ncbi:MAG: peptidoglycan recognition family protein [Planctomycetota bacterium]
MIRATLVFLTLSSVGFAQTHHPGDELKRSGDEILVCGQLFHTTAPVLLWTDPGGYDAYRVERRFADFDKSSWEASVEENPGLDSPNRYGLRKESLSDKELERVRGGGWDLAMLQGVVDQFVMHYDVCGTSQTCFKVLHDHRCLSVHFMLDVDGTIYQTLDLKERAWHATISNGRSIGIEIANIGAYPPDDMETLDRWYQQRGDRVLLNLPKRPGLLGVRTAEFKGGPIRNELVKGVVQGQELVQYDLTPQQYDSLIKLTATLCRIFPKLECKYPQDESGQLIPHKLEDDAWTRYRGILGHYHVQQNKVDPGPAFQWDRVVDGANELLSKTTN